MEFQDGAHYRLQRYAVAVLVNTPQGCADYFRIDLQSINSLLAFLRRQLKEPEYLLPPAPPTSNGQQANWNHCQVKNR